MVARNEKSMMKLVRLLIFRLTLLKGEILWLFENSKNLKDSYGWVASLATQPYKYFTFFKLSIFHKISLYSNIGLKTDNLTNYFIMLFSFLTTVLHLFL